MANGEAEPASRSAHVSHGEGGLVYAGGWRVCVKGAELWVRDVQQGKEFGCGIILLVQEKTSNLQKGWKSGATKRPKQPASKKEKETLQLQLEWRAL